MSAIYIEDTANYFSVRIKNSEGFEHVFDLKLSQYFGMIFYSEDSLYYLPVVMDYILKALHKNGVKDLVPNNFKQGLRLCVFFSIKY